MDVFSVNSRESPSAAAGNEAESRQEEEKRDAREQIYLDMCPVCHLNFHSRDPKLLPCLHSFCKKCLPPPSNSLTMRTPSNADGDGATKPLPVNVIRCPLCRQECTAADVIDNVFVKDSAETPCSSTVDKTVQLCMSCDDNTEAAGFCVGCAEYLCAICVEAHRRVKLTKDHIIRERTDALQDIHGVSVQKPMFCDIHKQEPLKLFCETCDCLTCRDCQLIKHKDHNYQFLEDAFKNHKQHMESMSHHLQEKKKLIEDLSNSIDNRLLQVDKNHASVHNEIKNSISRAILEINKKGGMLLNQLESVTKDHESILRKQQQDIGYLSRHLDHVINFIKWATVRNGGTALLYCKRLILFQIENLLQAKCSAAFIPQSTVHFQCQASYWASNFDLGSLVVESVPGDQHGGFQGIPHHPGQDSSDSTQIFVLGAPQHHSTLAQLQMQVDKLNSQTHSQTPQPPSQPWTWYQSVPLQRTVPGPLQGTFSSQRSMMPPSNHISPSSSLCNPGFSTQITHLLRGGGSSCSCRTTPVDVSSSSSSLHTPEIPLPISRGVRFPQAQQVDENRNISANPVSTVNPVSPLRLQLSSPSRNVQGQANSPEYAFVPQEDKPGTVFWNSLERHHDSGAVSSATKRKRRSSPEPVLVFKDEPVDDRSHVRRQ